MEKIRINLETRKYLLIFILLFLPVDSVTSTTQVLVGLFPINSSYAFESENLTWATHNFSKSYLPENALVEVKDYDNSNQEGAAMEAMLEIFAQPKDLTAIIGPSSETTIHNLNRFFKSIPQKVLHLVYNPGIESEEYLHNTAPPVSEVVDRLIDLLVEMEWNYIAIMRDRTEFSRLSYKLFKEKAKQNRTCIGIAEVMYLADEEDFVGIAALEIKGILVFGKQDFVRSVSRNGKKRQFHFIFASNENLHHQNTIEELPDKSIQVFWSGSGQQTNSNVPLKYITDSVRMSLEWFKICQNLSTCRDLQNQEPRRVPLDIYQKKEHKLFKVEINEKEPTGNLIHPGKSFCTKNCKICRILDAVSNPYVQNTVQNNETRKIVLVVPLHENDIPDPFKCSETIRMSESIDIIEAARFAIKTSANPDLGLIVVDSCKKRLVTTEKLIDINYSNVLGVVGGYYSLTTVPAAEVLTRLYIPQISYGAQSHELSDNGRFPYLHVYSTSLKKTTEAIILLCVKMGWRAINIMYDNEAYGISGQSLLIEYADLHGICIVNNIKVESENKKFPKHLNQLRKTNKVKIVINFMLEKSQEEWADVLKDDLGREEFLFITSYQLNEATLSKILIGDYKSHLFIEFIKPTNHEFIKYYTNLRRSHIKKNPWSKDFIEEISKCRFKGSFNTDYSKECTYKLPANEVSSYHELLIRSMYAMINGTLKTNPSTKQEMAEKISMDIRKKAEKISMDIRKTTLNISGKTQRIFDDTGTSLMQDFSLKRVENGLSYSEVATFQNGEWESSQLDTLSSFTSVCESHDSCTVCPEENETVYIGFMVLDIILALVIFGVLGYFLWRKRSSLLRLFIEITN